MRVFLKCNSILFRATPVFNQCILILISSLLFFSLPYHWISLNYVIYSFNHLPPSVSLSPSLILRCPTSLLSSWMEKRLTWESNEARDTSTTHCLVTADAPLNQSTTNQQYYIINSVNRAGQWLRVQYCFHLTSSEVKWESHPLRCQDCQQMTNDSDTINHFHLSFHSKDSKAPLYTKKRAIKQA